MKRRILLLTDWYKPGFKAGGPIQSCANMVQNMSESIDFFILTGDRDLGDNNPYPGIETGRWIKGAEQEHIFYVKKSKMGVFFFRQLVADLNPDTIYLNSMYSPRFTLLPLISLISAGLKAKIVIAPRGMLQAGAMQFSTRKKEAILSLLKLSRLSQRIIFHATDDQERLDILKYFPSSKFVQAPNIPTRPAEKPAMIIKIPGELKLIFVSRLHPKKNLDFLLRLLTDWKGGGRIELKIFGSFEDPRYEEKCRELALELPGSIHVSFEGSANHNEVQCRLLENHLFVLPTQGENFGHAIFEALAAGKPVLISDQTPWRDMQSRWAGWDLPLGDKQAYLAALSSMMNADQFTYNRWSEAAWKLARNYYDTADFSTKYKAVLL